MNKKILFFGMAAVMIISLSAFNLTNHNASTYKGEWVKLGSKKVNFRAEKDVIQVGIRDGRFTKLKLIVSGGSLNMHRMVVHFGNDTRQEIKLKHNFRKGSDSRVIDLKGNKRVIKKITFVYDSKRGGRATLTAFGKR